MNKADFVTALAKEAKISENEANIVLKSFEKIVKETLVAGDVVKLVGFGSFFVIERRSRLGRDFKTGRMMKVAPSKTVKFKVGKNLRNAIRK